MNNENRFACKKEVVNYICPYCKKEHSTPKGMANCIFLCDDKLKEAEEKRRQDKLAEQKECRKNEVKNQWSMVREYQKKAIELEDAYRRDYLDGTAMGLNPPADEINLSPLSDEIHRFMRTLLR